MFTKNSQYHTVEELFHGDMERFFSYLSEQNTRISSYGDYLTACRYLGLDMTEPKHLVPHEFRRWHDIRIDEYRSKKAAEDAVEGSLLHSRKRILQQTVTV